MKRKILVGVGVLFGLLFLWVGIVFLASAVVKSRVPVSLPPFANVFPLGDEYITAIGTWVIEGQKQAFPLQTTQIHCEKELRRCTTSTAQVMLGDQMHVDVRFYEIIEWGKAHVVFVDDAPSCVRYIYTIDLITKAVNAVRQKHEKPRGGAASCDGMERQLRLTLRGGFEVWNALQEDAIPWFGQIALAPLKLLR